jgi:predicted nucleic-acid-binding protein
MIGLDANILLRAVTRDDAIQSPLARRLIGGLTPDRPGCVSTLVLCEFAWTLKRRYRYKRTEIATAISAIVESPAFLLPERQTVNAALGGMQQFGLDFADAVIGHQHSSAGAETTLTFDRKAVASPLFTLVREES